jgi:hypothetical protein
LLMMRAIVDHVWTSRRRSSSVALEYARARWSARERPGCRQYGIRNKPDSMVVGRDNEHHVRQQINETLSYCSRYDIVKIKD